MNQLLLRELKEWRQQIAEQQGVPVYRVFNNQTLEEIAQQKPKDKQELLAIKGIKEKKLAKYGQDILSLIQIQKDEIIGSKQENQPYQVSAYLNWVNSGLREKSARVIGEISSLNIQPGYLFFSLKDQNDESLLSCFMWKRDYQLSGIDFEEGMELIVQGYPEIYKPNGRFSLRVATAELVGEGALKKAYLLLKNKLEKQGLFVLEKKQAIPEFPRKIGLITSATGAVIHDFLNNLGQYGFQIKFYSSRVEGQSAVKDLLAGIEYFSNQEIDLLIIIRGGGSLESLQAFNNETLVRKIAEFNSPVICGIGHDQDTPLACLAADLKTSTPTAASTVLNQSWEKGIQQIELFEKEIIYQFKDLLIQQNQELEVLIRKLKNYSSFIFKRFNQLENEFREKISWLRYRFDQIRGDLKQASKNIFTFLENDLKKIKEHLQEKEKKIRFFDPKRQLKLGYSIISLNQKVIKETKQVELNDQLDIQVSDGKIKGKVKKIIKK